MIVPVLDLPAQFSDANEAIAKANDSIQRAALLGRVAIRATANTNTDALEKLVVAASGYCDLQILTDVDSFSDDFAYSLLNAGASHILLNQPPEETTIPSDRILIVENVLSAAQELDPTQIADDWKSDKDWHIVLDDENVFSELVTDTLLKLLRTDREDGLWATVIVDRLGIALGLAYSNEESLRAAIQKRVGCYWSRSRDSLWIKGATSGATQALVEIRLDCDYDTLRFKVEQGPPGFCHEQTHTCFGAERNFAEVIARLAERVEGADTASFTHKLFNDPEMLRKKLLEEAGELSEADSRSDAAWEAADVLYFSLIAMMRNGAEMHDVFAELARRMNRIQRRKNKLEP